MVRYSKGVSFIFLMTLIAINACKKDENCSLHPEPFTFSIIDSETSADLIETGIYDIGTIGIHYIYKDERNDLIINQETNPAGDYTELMVHQLPMISLTGRSNIFYLELSEGITDTLKVIVVKEVIEGCDHHNYASAKHNGKELETGVGGVYLIKK